jgi:3-deoxy-D-manno-octulosonic-acid transferase
MRFLYDLFFIIFGILYLPYLALKRKVHGDFLQRFSFLPGKVTRLEKPVWIHAVSVGEAALAGKLSVLIKQHFPDIPIIISTTTTTGNAMAVKACADAANAVFYFPLDISLIVSRAVRLIDPRLYVMVETELWPNLLEEFHSKGIPVVLANGRISDASFANYGKIKFIMRRILRTIDCFCMQSQKDASRIRELGGLPEDKVYVTGNIKFDETIGSSGDAMFHKEYFGFSNNDEVLVAGSTHFPEEEALIAIYGELKVKRKRLKLILAPRHIERTDDIKTYIEKSDMEYCRFSEILSEEKTTHPAKDVVLVDTIGHLRGIYNAATLIFVGGSLARKGGQNPIEGARWGKAIVFGPHMYNFKEIAGIFVEGGGAVSVKDEKELKAVIEGLLENSEKREHMARNAKRIIDENSGAIKRTLERIEKYLS